MRTLATLDRTTRRARKAFAHSVAVYAEAETPKAQRRAERRANATRRAMVQAERLADWMAGDDEFAGA